MLLNVITDKDSEEAKAANLLADILICKRCLIRQFHGSFGEYDVPENEEPVQKGAHCPACLGILEGSTLLSAAKAVADKLNENNYDSPTFQLGITIPQCIILRQASVKTYLKDNGCRSLGREPDYFLKNTVKIYMAKLVETLTKKTLEMQSTIQINIVFTFPGDLREISKLDSLLKTRKNKDQAYRTEAVLNAVKSLPDSQIKRYAVCPPQSISEACQFTLNVSHASIFIGGRYNKFSRNLSQTPWFVEGVRRTETSTLELIGERLKEFIQGTSIKLQSSGREDADVRMLGNGRPFAIEITDPKVTLISTSQMMTLQAEINSATDKIAVNHLHFVTKADLDIMKKGEEDKAKSYRAKIWCPDHISDELISKLNAMTEIELQQKTPIRVLHRRPLLTRVRKVHTISIKRIKEKDCYELDLETQAGTYIKEFVHGDFGRTNPSLRTIFDLPVDILELDVTSIDMVWPVCSVEDTNNEKCKEIDIEKKLAKPAMMVC